MSKYIIEIKPEYEDKFKGVMILGAENSNLYVDSNTVDELEELTADYINEHYGDLQDTAYQKGFEDGKKEAESSEAIEQAKADAFNKGILFKEEKIHDAYQRGLEEGKAQAERGCKGCEYEGKTGEHLPCDYCMNNFRSQWTAKDDKIEVGDEVKSLSDSGVEIEGLLPWVVTTVDQGDYCQGIDSKGEVHATKKVRACKTGRHFDIKSILEDMRHD